jgi:DsbC/DsbD-like thiol-disulfide interchange protein
MMMIRATALAFAAACAASHGFVQSGQATADWWTSSVHYRPGEPVETAIRMEVDPGWHTYWSNPGEGGMKLSVDWELPEGWSAGEPAHPVPVRFMTGGLAGFGYEGEVLFPVTVTPPAGATGETTLKAKVSWLTCDDSACVPGDAVLTLTLLPGKPLESANARAIAAARAKVPQPMEGAALAVAEEGATLVLQLRLPEGSQLDPARSSVFPETPQAVDPAAVIGFTRDGDHWAARVPKNEYAAGPLKELTLVLAPDDGSAPAAVTWKAE